MKKILLAISMWVLASTTAFAQGNQRLFDDAGLFTGQEAQQLENRMQQMEPEFFIVTTDDTGGRGTEEFAHDAFDEVLTQNDGALFLIDMDNRNLWILTAGNLAGIDVDPLLDGPFEFLVEGQYFAAADRFLDDISLVSGSVRMGSERISDEIGGLTDSQLRELETRIHRFESEINADFFVLLTRDSRGLNHSDLVNALADNLEHNGSSNGIFLLIDYANLEVSLQNWGTTHNFLQDAQREQILDEIFPYLNGSDNTGAINLALDRLESFHSTPQVAAAAGTTRNLTWLFWLSAIGFYIWMMNRFKSGKQVPGFLLKKRRAQRMSSPSVGGGHTTFGGGAQPFSRQRRSGMGPFGWFMMGRMSAPRRHRSPWGWGGGWGAPRPPRMPRQAPPRPAPRQAAAPKPTRSSTTRSFGSNAQQRSSSSRSFGSNANSNTRSSSSRSFGNSSNTKSSSSKTFGSSNRSGSTGSFGGGGRSGSSGSFGSGSRPGGGFGSRPSGPPRGGGGGSRGGGGRKF